VLSLAVGTLAYAAWASATKKWPFAPSAAGKMSDTAGS
jgi:hypothetical protein